MNRVHGHHMFKRQGLKIIQAVLSLCFMMPQMIWGQEASPLSLEQVLTLSPDMDAAIITARTELASAQRDLSRIQSDPLALRLDILQAEQNVASKQEALERARLSHTFTVTQAFFNALETDESLASARLQLEIARATLKAQEIRFQAGAITQIDLSNAENDAVMAERSVSDAQNARNFAYSQLANYIGQMPSVLAAYNAETPVLASLEEYQNQALLKNIQLNLLKRSLELAQVQLQIVDNDFSSRSQIESARDNLSNAQLNLADYQDNLGLSIESSYNSVISAQASYQNAVEALKTATNDLNAQHTRLKAGSISPIAYQQSELAFAQKQAALSRSRHQLCLAFIRLEQAILGAGQ